MAEPYILTKKNKTLTSHKSYNFIPESYKKVNLSKLGCSEKTMSKYTYPKEFIKLDLDRIREFIDILEEYYQNLVDKGDMLKAKSVKQRLIILKNLEKEKMKKEAKLIYSNQRELVQEKMKEELENYINNTSREIDSILQVFEAQEIEMSRAQKEEKEELIKNYDEIYESRRPKPSKKMLNWIKIRDYAIKQNNFDKLTEVNLEISELKEKEDNKFESEKENTLKEDIKKLNLRHENDKKALLTKKNNLIDSINKENKKTIEQIKLKYEAKMKELKNYQCFEMSSFDKITKGITKPSSRIQNIVKSTSIMREGEGEELRSQKDNDVIKDKETITQREQNERMTETEIKERDEKLKNTQEENDENTDNIEDEEHPQQELKNDIQEENELEEEENNDNIK